jgi:catechol 2,3-dioxygenase-like lactoylglutathione lyase family enzyme
MAILSGIPVLNCRDIEVSLEFYQQLLQFVVVKKREVNAKLDWVHLMHGSTTLMLQAYVIQDGFESVKKSSSLSLYFFVDNIDELHHFLSAKNSDVSEIEVTHYKMKEFFLLDPDGNKIVIGQS